MVMHRYLTESEQALLLATVAKFAAVQARRDRAWIHLLIHTGMRIGEFSRFSTRQARLALSGGWIFIPREHRKGRQADHSVPATAPVLEDLRALLRIRAEMGAPDDDGPLVISRRGEGMSIRGFQERFAHWCRQCGLQASPHWLRHTRAKNIMRRSKSEDPRGIVQAALGHRNIGSTGIYTAIDKETLQQELESVDGGRRARRQDLRGLYEVAL